MSRIFLIAALLITVASAAKAQTTPTGRDVVKKMHDRYDGKWYRTFTFNQTTEVYRNDTLKSTSTWYEFIRFPDRFRMDFGPADSGNAAIFRGDSCYRFKNFQLRSTTINNNEGLIFLLGGMFFYPLDQAYTILDSLHYDLSKTREDTWKDRPVYVIGAEGGNQLWIDKDRLYLSRMIKVDGQQTVDARFDGYRQFDGGWSETQCSFYINSKLIQVETYHDCKANTTLDDRIFDPGTLIRSHP
jgi:outer membrane lipoprotein-sorting protein